MKGDLKTRILRRVPRHPEGKRPLRTTRRRRCWGPQDRLRERDIAPPFALGPQGDRPLRESENPLEEIHSKTWRALLARRQEREPQPHVTPPVGRDGARWPGGKDSRKKPDGWKAPRARSGPADRRRQ